MGGGASKLCMSEHHEQDEEVMLALEEGALGLSQPHAINTAGSDQFTLALAHASQLLYIGFSLHEHEAELERRLTLLFRILPPLRIVGVADGSGPLIPLSGLLIWGMRLRSVVLSLICQIEVRPSMLSVAHVFPSAVLSQISRGHPPPRAHAAAMRSYRACVSGTELGRRFR
jgi:hypothetical protein